MTRHDTTRHDTTRHDTAIVVPVYNVEKYLPQCIDSIIHQTYPHIDIILVDDGSTDSSGRICDQYASLDPRISIIHKTNGGLSDARNAGLSHARSKYVYFLDSDDYIEPETVEILRSVCEQDSLDILSFDVNEIIIEGRVREESYDYWVASGTYPDVMTGCQLYTALCNNHDYKSPLQVHFFRREFLTSSGLTFRKGIIHEDELFTSSALLRAQRAMHIPARLYNRRMRPDSIMTRAFTQRNSDSLHAILREILSEHVRFHDDPATREAYDLGVRNLARTYAERYAYAFGQQDSRGHSQFREMMSGLQALGYDTSRCTRRVKLRHLYSLKSAVGRILPGIKKPLKSAAKSCLSLAKKAAKRVTTRFLDGEARSIIARLSETNRPGVNRIITLCVPRHGNRGDIAISLAQRKLLAENFPGHVLIELPGDLCAGYPRLITRNLNTNDVLLTNGGGYFGSLWRNEMLAELNILRHFPHNRIIVMPQTWYYSDDGRGRKELACDRRAFSQFTDLHVFARDRNSFDLIQREGLYPNARSIHHVPDMVCSMDFTDLVPEKRSGVLVCLRPDPEKVMDSQKQNEIVARLLRGSGHVGFFSTNPANSPVKIRDWEAALAELLTRIAWAELVVTDRLHGMLFAAITGTPCVAFDNRTGKVSGVHEWIAGCEYVQMCGGTDEFGGAVDRAMSAPNVWDNSELRPYFSEIVDAISGRE